MATPSRFGPRRVVPVAVATLAVTVLLLAGCAAGAHHRDRPAKAAAALTSQRAPVTHRHTFVPYTSSGRLTVPVAAHATGWCWSTSLADPIRSAFRCFAGNSILDPCFAAPGTGKGGTVACVADPWSKATVLTLTKALPGKTFTIDRVWAFERSDGTTCVAATGTVPAVAGRNLDYNCSDHTFAALGSTTARHVRTVFAGVGATALRAGTVRDLWHS